MPIKLILDRSAFHGKRFNRLAESLTNLRNKGHVSVYITPMLLEETLGLLLDNGHDQELVDHLKFIVNISEDSWFEDNFEIFKSELRVCHLHKDYYYMNKIAKSSLKAEIMAIIQGGTISSDDLSALNKIAITNRKKTGKMRKIGLEMRSTISSGVKKLGLKHGKMAYHLSWEAFKRKHLNKFGKDLIWNKNFKEIWHKYIASLYWIFNKRRCGYFTEWATGLLYMQYYAMTYPNDTIDKNAQADIQHLIYLRNADGIISEDLSFMKKAWEELYKNRKKLYLSIEDLKTMF
jgi:hypothetical protein